MQVRSTIIKCFFERAVLDTKNEANYSSSVTSLFSCFKLKAAASQQLMGQLPLARGTVARPFINAGIVYVGPFEIKSGNTRSKTTTKCYVALFICMATKAIHLELVSNLTSEAFIAALKRFIARRGLINHLYSDNGSNFVGAN